MPDTIPLKCPRTTDRGAASGEKGLLNRINAEGPNAGKTRERPVSQARRQIVRMANAPFAPDMSEMTFCSSQVAKNDGIDNLARHVNNHILIDIRRLLAGITFLTQQIMATDTNAPSVSVIG